MSRQPLPSDEAASNNSPYPSLDLVQSPIVVVSHRLIVFLLSVSNLAPVSHPKYLPSFTLLFTFLSPISKMLLLLVAPLYPGMPSHFTTRLIPFLYHAVLRHYHSSGYMATADYFLSFISPRERLLLWNLSLCIRSLTSFLCPSLLRPFMTLRLLDSG